MKTKVYLGTLARLQDRLERAESKEADALAELERADGAYRVAVAAVDSADDAGDPHRVSRAHAALNASRDAKTGAETRLKDLDVLVEEARADLDAHRRLVRVAFDAGVKDLRDEVSEVLDKLARDWAAAASSLLFTASEVIALERALGGTIFLPYSDGASMAEQHNFIPFGVEAMLDNLKVPAFGTGGFGYPDIAVSRERASASASEERYRPLGDARDALQHLARLVADAPGHDRPQAAE